MESKPVYEKAPARRYIRPETLDQFIERRMIGLGAAAIRNRAKYQTLLEVRRWMEMQKQFS